MAKERRDFYPDYLFEILVVAAVVLELVVALALLFPPQIGRQIDFSAPFQPLPEWYFYWLFQIVRYFPGQLTFIGAFLIPCAALLLLICIPFIDRDGRGRLAAVCVGAILVLTFVVFTLIPALRY